MLRIEGADMYAEICETTLYISPLCSTRDSTIQQKVDVHLKRSSDGRHTRLHASPALVHDEFSGALRCTNTKTAYRARIAYKALIKASIEQPLICV